MSHRDVGLRRVAELVVVAHGVPALIAAVDLHAFAVRDAADYFPVDARVASQEQRRALRRDDAGAHELRVNLGRRTSPSVVVACVVTFAGSG